ncbi:hypothetical protein BLNAU_17980 [Blattamonas nauphoetae]|uniref:Uncharacterized protein n=1 Tax=Blattamonas nauphoetae TaxID=2049346 RepID=A0ABQ9X5L2_9EUKA|nr:hypothetical protein BLNAU_17980 [Blattamonas nauphoetae]
MSSLDDAGTKVMVLNELEEIFSNLVEAEHSIGDVDVTVTFLYADAETLTVVESNCTPCDNCNRRANVVVSPITVNKLKRGVGRNEHEGRCSIHRQAHVFERVRQLQHNEEAVFHNLRRCSIVPGLYGNESKSSIRDVNREIYIQYPLNRHPVPILLLIPLCSLTRFRYFTISDARHPHSAQHFLLPTSLPSAEKSSVLPPITGCEEKNQHICILVDQAPLPHVFTPLSPNLAFPLPSEYDWRLVNVNDNPTFPSDKDLKTLVEPAFRANNNKKVVLCGHSTDDIITYRFLTSSVVDQSWIDTYIFAVITSGAPFGGAPMADGTLTQDCACLHWMIPNKNTFDDDCVVVRLKSDNVCKILMKNMTWTDNQAGKACVKTAVQRTRNNTDQPLVLPKVMTHVMYSIGINATAGVILNATSQRWSSDTHSDYYMDGDGTVPTVSLSITPLVERHLARLVPHIPWL